MRAMYYEAFGAAPEIRTLPDPTPTNAGVVISVKATGLCRSDWHGWQGHDADIVLPHVPGHELAGTIAAIGKDVRRFKIGDRVTVPFVSGCGRCEECHSGHQHVCAHQMQPGFTHWGSFADYVGLDNRFSSIAAIETHLRKVLAPFGPLTDAQWQHLVTHGHRRRPDGTFGLAYDPAIAVNVKAAVQDWDLWAIWDRIKSPTLVLRGAESDLLLEATAQEMTQRGPNAQLVTWNGMGHAPALMDPQQIALLQTWLTDK